MVLFNPFFNCDRCRIILHHPCILRFQNSILGSPLGPFTSLPTAALTAAAALGFTGVNAGSSFLFLHFSSSFTFLSPPTPLLSSSPRPSIPPPPPPPPAGLGASSSFGGGGTPPFGIGGPLPLPFPPAFGAAAGAPDALVRVGKQRSTLLGPGHQPSNPVPSCNCLCTKHSYP